MYVSFVMKYILVFFSDLFSVRCTEGDIRLAGLGPTSGRVEVCIYEQWNSLCSETWTAQNTEVVCRQLGYASRGASNLIL